MDEKKLGDGGLGAVLAGAEDQVNAGSYAMAVEIFAIPHGLAAEGGGFIHQVTGYIGDFYAGIADQSGNHNIALVTRPHRVGEGIDLAEGFISGIGCASEGDQSPARSEEHFTGKRLDGDVVDGIGEEGTIVGGEMVNL